MLDEIVDNNQTAYVKGRAVGDNLRSMKFLKDHCMEDEVEAVSISLYAKKAFDSIDHGYIDRVPYFHW